MENIIVPRGDSKAVVKQREEIIHKFYQEWRHAHPEQKLYNVDLKDFINIRQISMIETKEHAAKSYLSTLAVLQLESILTCAKRVKRTGSEKHTANQKKFESMIVMRHFLPAIGEIKLTVGVMRTDKKKVQYSITAIESETRKAPLVRSAKLCPEKTQ